MMMGFYNPRDIVRCPCPIVYMAVRDTPTQQININTVIQDIRRPIFGQMIMKFVYDYYILQ